MANLSTVLGGVSATDYTAARAAKLDNLDKAVSSAGKTLNSQTFNSSGTFTVPAGVYVVEAYVLGGGSGGSFNSSPGGYGGGLSTGLIATTPGTAMAVTVGGGGAGGTAISGPGSGGRSAFGDLSANGSTSYGIGRNGESNAGGNGGNSGYGSGGATSGSHAAANSGGGGSGGGKSGGSGHVKLFWYE